MFSWLRKKTPTHPVPVPPAPPARVPEPAEVLKDASAPAPVVPTDNHAVVLYPAHLKRLQSTMASDMAHQMAVGGSFYASGRLQYLFMREMGVTDESVVVDVGCGSGRLAVHFSPYPKIRYVGTDVVQGLLDYAKTLTQRNDWQYLRTDGLTIPLPDDFADFICFFSVLTHTKHEESYKYLREAKRVIKPDGKIIFSFLEFSRPFHWAVFETQVRDAGPETPLTQFMDRDAIRAWADHLDLVIEKIFDGGVPHIKIDEEIVWDDGRKQTGLGDVGHSICVMRRK